MLYHPQSTQEALQTLERALEEFTAVVAQIQAEPYKLRRTIAAWPYYADLQHVILSYQMPNTTPQYCAYNQMLLEKLLNVQVLSSAPNDAWK